HANLGHSALAQGGHAFIPRYPLDLGSRPPVDDHFTNTVGQVEQFADRGSAVETASGALQAASPLVEGRGRPRRRIEAGFAQFFCAQALWPLAAAANYAHEPLHLGAAARARNLQQLQAAKALGRRRIARSRPRSGGVGVRDLLRGGWLPGVLRKRFPRQNRDLRTARPDRPYS